MRKAQREALEARSSDLREKLRAYSSPSFDRRVNLREAESLLSSYQVEEIRYFMRAGVFAEPLRGVVKDYLFRRITNGDLANDRHSGCDPNRG